MRALAHLVIINTQRLCLKRMAIYGHSEIQLALDTPMRILCTQADVEMRVFSKVRISSHCPVTEALLVCTFYII